MTERVFVGNDNGSFKMRISKSGIEARNANIDQCLVHESKQRPLMYIQQGYVGVPPGSTVNISLGRSFAFPPVIILKHESHQTLAVTARLSLNTGNLSLTSRPDAAGSLTKYVVLFPV